MNVQFIKGFDEGSRPESVKDSNSFSGESDTGTSVFCGAKFEVNQAMTCTYDSSTTKTMSFGEASSESTHFSIESSTAMESISTDEEVAFAKADDRIETIHKLQEHLLELDSHEDYDCAEYGNRDIEQCTDQELEELFGSNALNTNTYILSSGRWTVNHGNIDIIIRILMCIHSFIHSLLLSDIHSLNAEAESIAKTPTIDQEFEQYFSMLML